MKHPSAPPADQPPAPVELTGAVSVSVVSHGHGAHVEALLGDLATHCALDVTRVVLTLNQPEPALLAFVTGSNWPFAVTVLRNAQPRSFGANHNRAFGHVATPFFCILNPDLRLPNNPFQVLMLALADAAVGCAYPVQVDPGGVLQDFERALPSPWAVLKRAWRGRGQSDGAEWVNGAFMLFKTDVYRRLGGFDERYRLYCEDVDICIRLQLEGFELKPADVDVVHLAQRATLRSARHLWWHLQSLWRLWCSPPYWRFLMRPRG